MSTQDWAIWLVRVAAVAQTTFVFLYGGFSPWWRNRVGRAIFTKAFALALLLDLALVNQAIGKPYRFMDQIALAVIALVTVGSVMQLLALLIEKVRPTSPGAFGTLRTENPKEN